MSKEMATRCCGGNKTKVVVKACGLVQAAKKKSFGGDL